MAARWRAYVASAGEGGSGGSTRGGGGGGSCNRGGGPGRLVGAAAAGGLGLLRTVAAGRRWDGEGRRPPLSKASPGSPLCRCSVWEHVS